MEAQNDATAMRIEHNEGKRPFGIGIAALILGVVALGLACIPALALDRPLPNPFADEKADAAQADETAAGEKEGGITLSYKNVSIRLGSKDSEGTETASQGSQAAPNNSDPIKIFTIAAIVCALVGLVVASIGQIRERHTALTMSAMGCCAAAIAWQYIAVGIAVGVGAAVLIALLSAMNC